MSDLLDSIKGAEIDEIYKKIVYEMGVAAGYGANRIFVDVPIESLAGVTDLLKYYFPGITLSASLVIDWG